MTASRTLGVVLWAWLAFQYGLLGQTLDPKRAPAPAGAAATDARHLTVGDWLEDLDFVVTALESRHPDPYYKTAKSVFDSVVSQSRKDITLSTSDLECYFAIKRIIAAVEDGHTGLLEDGLFNLLDLRFPFRVDEFTDGVYITLARMDHERLLGSRVTAVNGKPIESVLETIERVAGDDNRFGRRYWALNGLSFARILQGLKIIESADEVVLELDLGNGNTERTAVRSIADDSPVEYGWSNRFAVGPTKGDYIGPSSVLGGKAPLYFQHQGKELRYYWYEHLAEQRAVYFQFNAVLDQPNGPETFAQFLARMWGHIDQNAGAIDKLIIDLRHNDGGNGALILPFLDQIIKREHINREGGLFVLSGKRTHSAASIFMGELAVHTRARFIGEPDACGSDLFSNSRLAGHLPHSGFPLWIAAFRFTDRWPGWPSDNTEYFMPHIPAPLSSRDYFGGHDPALEMALRGDCRSVAEYAAEKGVEAGIGYYQRLKDTYKDIGWWTDLDAGNLERSANRKGYDLISCGDLQRAFRVFTLATTLFPDSSNAWDSLGECCLNMKDYDQALRHYRRSIDLDPRNENAKRMIERILERMKRDESLASGHCRTMPMNIVRHQGSQSSSECGMIRPNLTIPNEDWRRREGATLSPGPAYIL